MAKSLLVMLCVGPYFPAGLHSSTFLLYDRRGYAQDSKFIEIIIDGAVCLCEVFKLLFGEPVEFLFVLCAVSDERNQNNTGRTELQ